MEGDVPQDEVLRWARPLRRAGRARPHPLRHHRHGASRAGGAHVRRAAAALRGTCSSPCTSTTRAAWAWPTCWPRCRRGIVRFDGSLGGLGGCPYAPGASGNICTEDAIHMLEAMGYDTGMDLRAAAAGRACSCPRSSATRCRGRWPRPAGSSTCTRRRLVSPNCGRQAHDRPPRVFQAGLSRAFPRTPRRRHPCNDAICSPPERPSRPPARGCSPRASSRSARSRWSCPRRPAAAPTSPPGSWPTSCRARWGSRWWWRTSRAPPATSATSWSHAPSPMATRCCWRTAATRSPIRTCSSRPAGTRSRISRRWR